MAFFKFYVFLNCKYVYKKQLPRGFRPRQRALLAHVVSVQLAGVVGTVELVQKGHEVEPEAVSYQRPARIRTSFC